MFDSAFQILAMGGAPNPNQPPAVQMISSLLPIVLIFVVFYFMLIRPQQKKQKEIKQMLDNLKSGDKIITTGGILGTVTNVKEKTVIVRIADNVKVEMLRSAIQTVTQKSAEGEAASGKN
ncbi:MAG: preprotein translocase subunit YajC [Verrucomicrobiae bacterium]|nr:preprotein translocase subunit YajC [Verrucomicrobiae bacterium]